MERTRKTKVILHASTCKQRVAELHDFHCVSLKSDSSLVLDPPSVARRAAVGCEDFIPFAYNSQQKTVSPLPETALWLVVSRKKKTAYRLSVGDILRFGLLTFRVSFLNASRLEDLRASTLHYVDAPAVASPVLLKALPAQCRICMSNSEEADPVVTPCCCSEDLGVHVSCLKKWLALNVRTTQTKFTQSFEWSGFACELCTQNYPGVIQVGQTAYSLLPCPTDASLILEQVHSSKKVVHVVSFRGARKLWIGRNLLAQVKLLDPSVCEQHAQLLWKDQSVYVVDAYSRYGTQVQVSHPIYFDQALKLQVQNTVYRFIRVNQRRGCAFSCYK